MVWIGACVSLEWSQTVSIGYGKCRCGYVCKSVLTSHRCGNMFSFLCSEVRVYNVYGYEE